MKIEGYDISIEEAAEIAAALVPINAVTKQEQALQLYVRGCEQQAERRAIEVCARLAERHQQSNLANELRRLPIPVEYLPSSDEVVV
jgi:uncharacterized protein YwlG (UPF0340 family)